MTDGLIFKIEIYFDRKKSKQKLYESRKAYDYWWSERVRWEMNLTRAGLVGYVDGKVDRTFGVVPEDKQKEKQ